jgi:trigger factor
MIADKTGQALAELVTADIPDALVEDQMQQQLQDMAMRLAQQGIQFEQFLEMTGQDAEALRETMREPAQTAARVDLALRAVAVAEAFEVTDDEIQAEIDESAAQMGQDGAELRQAFEEGGQITMLRADMLKRRAMDMLVESVEIVDEEGNPIDRADLEPIEEDDPATGNTEASSEADLGEPAADGEDDGNTSDAETVESSDSSDEGDE